MMLPQTKDILIPHRVMPQIVVEYKARQFSKKQILQSVDTHMVLPQTKIN